MGSADTAKNGVGFGRTPLARSLRRATGVVVLFVLLVPGAAWSDSVAVLRPAQADGTDFLDLSPYLAVFRTSRALRVEEVQSEPLQSAFRRPGPRAPSFGYTADEIWARVRIQNLTPDAELRLELAYPVLDHADLYLKQADGAWIASPAGDRLPFSARDIHHRNFIYRLPIPPGATREAYLRIRSETSVQIPLRLWRPANLERRDQSERALIAAYYGVMAIMLVYNLMFFFGFRDPVYLFYFLYGAATGFVLLTQSGLAYQMLWPESVEWNGRAQAISVLCACVFLCEFTRRFLRAPIRMPRLNRMLTAAALLSACLALAGAFLPITHALRMASLLVVPVAAFCLGVGSISALRGYRPAWFYVFAFAIILIAAALMSLRNVGLLPHTFVTTHGLLVGSAIEIFTLSLALAYRVRLVDQERIDAQIGVIEHIQAARAERQRLLADCHDHLGARLTDIVLQLERLRTLKLNAVQEDAALSLQREAQNANRELRDLLLQIEDRSLMEADFLQGMQAMLLRRYVAAGRPLRVRVAPALAERMQTQRSATYESELQAAFLELATNDLKYGCEESRWSFELDHDALALAMSAGSAHESAGGYGSVNLRERLARIQGEMQSEVRQGQFVAYLRAPLPGAPTGALRLRFALEPAVDRPARGRNENAR